ncbi:MAG TPA: ATP-binding protein [Alphaproteobacteria bacterium]|nr:ATP-binding protein [Alphaproteobacteria bacterium]
MTNDEGIAAIALSVPPLPPETSCREIYSRFEAAEDVPAIPIAVGDRPVGLVNRNDMFALWATRFGRALYERKAIAEIMDERPLIVDVTMNLDALRSLILGENPGALVRGFILARDGSYAGIGTALSLLRLAVSQAEQRNKALQDAKVEAEAANRSKSQFLANMSHELRTPLNAIIGFAELIKDERFGPVGQARYLEYAGDIFSSGNHLLSLINDILDMAKIEAGRMELHEEDVAVAEVVEEAARLLRQCAEESLVVLAVSVENALPDVRADRRALRQMLLNLIGNAVKFTPAGGRIAVTAAREGDCVEFRIVDTGIGIAPEHMDTVLAPFGQVANELTRSHPGTGLGLPLVKALAELHGARLSLTSEVGRGTTAVVRFPADRSLLRKVPLRVVRR